MDEDLAEEEVEEVNLVRTEHDAVVWLVEITGCDPKLARLALKKTNGEISDALDILPELQKSGVPVPKVHSTEDDIRALIDAADASTDVIKMTDDVITISDDVITISDDVITVSDTDEGPAATTVHPPSAVQEGAAERISRDLHVSLDRARAALRMCNQDEAAAVDVISRQLRKRKRSSSELKESCAEVEITPAVSNSPWELLVLSWNVDGLCDRGISERFSAVISEIKTKAPHVVMLQEVVSEHVDRIKSCFGKSYDITLGDRSNSYFNAILVTRKVGNLNVLNKYVKKFHNTIMGRHAVQVDCTLFGSQFSFFTSHLESMKNHSAERCNQLNKMLSYMAREQLLQNITLFGGDMNLRDSEVKRLQNLHSYVDVWEGVGCDPETRYTWDTVTNTNTGASYKSRLRFDRMYLRKSCPGKCEPVSLNLTGKTKLQSCGMYPSDHWGLLARFRVQK